jgi:hypothetical protein
MLGSVVLKSRSCSLCHPGTWVSFVQWAWLPWWSCCWQQASSTWETSQERFVWRCTVKAHSASPSEGAAESQQATETGSRVPNESWNMQHYPARRTLLLPCMPSHQVLCCLTPPLPDVPCYPGDGPAGLHAVRLPVGTCRHPPGTHHGGQSCLHCFGQHPCRMLCWPRTCLALHVRQHTIHVNETPPSLCCCAFMPDACSRPPLA